MNSIQEEKELMTKQSSDFSETLVAFFDIQGYSTFVSNHSKSEVIKKTKELVSSNLNTAQTNFGGVKFESLVLSDSLIIVVDTKRHPIFKGSVHLLLVTCSSILAQSLKIYKIPLRGAIGGGWYFKEGDILASSALVEAASFERAQDWYGMVIAPAAEKLILQAYNGVEGELLKQNDGFLKKGLVPWKDKYKPKYDKRGEYYFVEPFKSYFGNLKELEFPNWFQKDSVKVKNSEKLYLNLD